MRESTRIKPLLEAIQHYWEKHPDLRLCQLLSNIAYEHGWEAHDLFYLEDSELMKNIMSQIGKDANENKS